MFATLVAGRLVETNFQQVGESQFLNVIHEADNLSHLAVFLTGQMPFPPGMAGLIYFSLPDLNAPPNWQLLGFISNEKPSSIFKISGLKKREGEHSGFLQFGQQAISQNAQIGISVESLDIVQQKMVQLEASKPNRVNKYLRFTQEMVNSFASTVANYTTEENTTFSIPLAALQRWFSDFERRLEMSPDFWKS